MSFNDIHCLSRRGDHKLDSDKVCVYCGMTWFEGSVAPASVPIPRLNKTRQVLLDRDGPFCWWCGEGVDALDSYRCTIDHIMPRSRGGTSVRTNLALTCRLCNWHKADLHPLVWIAMLLSSPTGKVCRNGRTRR